MHAIPTSRSTLRFTTSRFESGLFYGRIYVLFFMQKLQHDEYLFSFFTIARVLAVIKPTFLESAFFVTYVRSYVFEMHEKIV